MSVIATLCDKIIEENARLGRKTGETLLPGIQRSEVSQRLKFMSLLLPESALELYEWSEGTDLKTTLWTYVSLLPGFGMGCLAEMIEAFQYWGGKGETSRFRYLDGYWFPLFDNECGDYYGICISNQRLRDASIVFHLGEFEPRVEFVRLEAMLQTILACLQSGVYYLDERGDIDCGKAYYSPEGYLLEIDNKEFKEIARRYNPGLSIYRQT